MIEYRVRRSARARRARVLVTREGEAVVVLPTRAPQRWAKDLVEARADWLRHHLQRASEERERFQARPVLGEGRTVPLSGLAHEVVVEALPGRRTRVEHDDSIAPTVRVLLAPGDERSIATIVERWLRAEARLLIDRRVAVRARDVGVTPVRVAVRDQRTRWGSASRAGTLSFSWRLALVPPAVLDYVVVHELAHLADFSHSPRFWARVRAVVPDADRARQWLRAHEGDLRHALD